MTGLGVVRWKVDFPLCLIGLRRMGSNGGVVISDLSFLGISLVEKGSEEGVVRMDLSF